MTTQDRSPLEVLGALPLAVVVLDVELRIASWNDAAEVLYGHRAEEVRGRSVLSVLFDEADRADAARVLAEAVVGTPWTGDQRVQRSDGVLLVSSFAAIPMNAGAAWIATDTIDQGLAEQERAVLLSAEHAARAEAEQALGLVEAILGSAPVGIAVFDVDLRYVRVNEAFAAISGVPAEQHIGGRVGEVVALPSEVGADLRRVVTTGRTILARPVEVDDPRPPHDRRHFTVSYFPVRTSAGTLVGAGATVIEVTDAKRAEAERVELLRRAESAQRRLAILATASTVLTTTMDVDELLDRLASTLTPSAADWAIIQLFDGAGLVEHVAVSYRDRARAAEIAEFVRANPITRDGGGPIAQVLRSGEGRLISPEGIADSLARAASDRGNASFADQFSLDSSVVVPIESRGEPLGVLILSTDRGRILDDDDLDLAVEVAHRAALALGNARAYQQEHQIAGALQHALLPSVVPAVPGLEIAVRYVAATDGASVGGDWYDVMGLDEGRVGLVVGDVVGHDIAASTSMGQLRSALRAYACEEQPHPARALTRVDRLFDALGLTYATCVLGTLDPSPASRQFRWSNAGHPPPLLVRDGRATFLRDGDGVMLGVTGGADANQAEIALRVGDVLVLYTDGLIERRTESLGDGMDRLATAAAGLAPSLDAEALCDALISELLPTSIERGDDVALLVVRVLGASDERPVHRLELVASPESAAIARGFVAGVLDAAGWGSVAETGVLLASELVTNAVRHGVPPCTLAVSVGDDEVEVAVEDGDPSVLPVAVRAADAFDEDGRGLLLVAGLSEDWGVRPLLNGKAIWFTLRRQ